MDYDDMDLRMTQLDALLNLTDKSINVLNRTNSELNSEMKKIRQYIELIVFYCVTYLIFIGDSNTNSKFMTIILILYILKIRLYG